MTVGGAAVYQAALEAAAEKQQRVGAAEMPVKTVHLFVLDHQLVARLLLGKADRLDARLWLVGGGAAELGGYDHQRALQQAAVVEIANELGQRGVDLLLQLDHSRGTVLMRIKTLERGVLIFDLHKPGTGFDQSPGCQ